MVIENAIPIIVIFILWCNLGLLYIRQILSIRYYSSFWISYWSHIATHLIVVVVVVVVILLVLLNGVSQSGLCGNLYKIYKPYFKLDIRKFFFSVKIIDVWNLLLLACK